MVLKVAQVCAVDFTVEKLLLPLVDAMQDQDWDVTIVCSPGDRVRSLEMKGYKFRTVNFSRSFNIISHITTTLRLINLFKTQQFDIVHAHTPVAGILARLASLLAGTPFIAYTAHGFYFHDQMSKLKYSIYYFLERMIFHITDLLFCQSAEDARIAKTWRRRHRQKIIHISNGVDLKKFKPARKGARISLRRELGVPENSFVVCMVARLVKEKGVPEYLNAAVELCKIKEDIFFILVGDQVEGDRRSDIPRNVDKTKKLIGGRFAHFAHRDDVNSILSASDLFCLPSRREGLPRSIIEAMAAGLPVVTSNIRGCRELVEDSINGMVINVQDNKSLFEAIEFFYTERSFGKNMGKAGRAIALSNHNEHDVIQTQIQSIIDAVELKILDNKSC